MSENKFVLEEINDPVAVARHRVVMEHYRRNSDWIQAHWGDVLPQAHGKYLAVAGQEPFIADTAQEAMALARAAHPEDQGIFFQYILPPGVKPVYADRW